MYWSPLIILWHLSGKRLSITSSMCSGYFAATKRSKAFCCGLGQRRSRMRLPRRLFPGVVVVSDQYNNRHTREVALWADRSERGRRDKPGKKPRERFKVCPVTLLSSCTAPWQSAQSVKRFCALHPVIRPGQIQSCVLAQYLGGSLRRLGRRLLKEHQVFHWIMTAISRP
jgi:hypothetical protein